MKAQELMTESPSCCAPSHTLREVARMMRDGDCGAVPVVENGRVVGIVTDRDLAIRGVAAGMDSAAPVDTIITRDPRCCGANDDIRDVEKIMADNQVRRVPVVDDHGRCIGIISQADLARAARDGGRISEREVAIVVEQVSAPPGPRLDRGPSDNFEQRL